MLFLPLLVDKANASPTGVAKLWRPQGAVYPLIYLNKEGDDAIDKGGL